MEDLQDGPKSKIIEKQLVFEYFCSKVSVSLETSSKNPSDWSSKTSDYDEDAQYVDDASDDDEDDDEDDDGDDDDDDDGGDGGDDDDDDDNDDHHHDDDKDELNIYRRI